jgi:integrase
LHNSVIHWSDRNDSTLATTVEIPLQKKEKATFDSRTQGFIDQLKKESTRNTYSAGLCEFQKFLATKKLTISLWLELVDEDRFQPALKASNIATDTLKDFVSFMEKKEKKLKSKDEKQKAFSANTINLYVIAVQSLVNFIYRGKYIITTKFAGLPDPDPESDKEAWTLELISKFFLSMDKPIYRALLAVIFQSGLGIEDVLNLKYKNIREEFEQGISPICLELKRKKTGVSFHTFLGTVAVNQLREYFKASGTPLPEQPIFHRETNSKLLGNEMKPLSKGGIERYFARRAKRFIKKAWVGENPRRPHSLRGAFQKLLILAGLAEIFTEYFLGHEVSRNKQAYIIKGMSKEEFRKQYLTFESALTFSTEEGENKFE